MRRPVKQAPIRRKLPRYTRVPLAAAIYLAIGSMAFAQDPPLEDPAEGEAAQAANEAARPQDGPVALEQVIVTSQKKVEDLQKVPISIQVLGEQTLEENYISDFDDFVRLLPSVSYQSFGPGFSQVYIRGVASGGDGNHSGSLPSVGIYLDEQPITTIQGALDLHIYDIERVEALAGPQGTLYGASSQSGTIRIITNKPDPSAFTSGYAIEGNTIDDGGSGYVAEGFFNAPIADNMAIRMVAWSKHDAGYIDNIFTERTFPTSGITIDNANRVEDDYNETDTYGLRAALKVDLNDSWSITPSIIYQDQEASGSFGYEADKGDLAIGHFYPERTDDQWYQAALTVQGKIGNFDLTYAYAHLDREVDSESDYNDYAFWYDTLYGYGAYFYDDNGDLVNPAQYIQGRDEYTKDTHELRLASPQDQRFRWLIGLFTQDQFHDIQQRYLVDNLADLLSVTGWPDTIWLTKQERGDNDDAVFGEISYDFTDQFTMTAGARYYRVDNTLKGFFGFSEGYFPGADYGEAACLTEEDFNGAPCLVNDKKVEEEDWLGRVNATYQFDDDRMVYATWSEGYRPGGINRRATLPPYVSDFLTNWELGFKTTWMDRRLSLNGALFKQEWDDFQFSILGANGLTEIKNAGEAEIDGLELELNWAATYNLMISGGVAFFDGELTANYCGFTDDEGNPVTECDDPEAPKGTKLPVTADFKGTLNARYTFELGSFEAYTQGTVFYEGDRTSDLRIFEREILGDLDSYALFDFSFGIKKNNWALDFYLKNAFDERSELFRFAGCAEAVCGEQTYTLTSQPRTFGVRFSQNF